MAEARGVRALRVPGVLAAIGVVLAATLRPSIVDAAPTLWTLTLVLLLILSLLAVPTRGREDQPMATVAITALGGLLPAGAMSYAIFLRHMPVQADPINDVWGSLVGASLVAYPLMVTWMTDSAAYFAGSRWGQRKLVPRVSPGKTVVGGVAGLIGGVVGGLLVALYYQGVLGIPLHPLLGALGGLLIGTISQVGDLAESVWKREAGVKDSGALFPGHGGILDRMDSLLFTIPASYWWLGLVLGQGLTW
jgi:phosphatidate cytidylyltransferase